MGKVYKVLHRGWNVELAVKSPKPEELERAGGAETFVRESETWVNLGLHPHTVSCYYVRSLGGIPRVFAEYVDGGSLSDWIAEGKLTDQVHIIDVLIQFAWGLAYSHERGLVHQDVKPANVMMTANGAAKVTDFGLAKARGSSLEKGADGLVAFGGMTPAYCSPEQAEKAPLSHKTDMWSYGVSALEIYTGELTWMSGVAARDALSAYLADETAGTGRPRMPEKVAALLKDILQVDTAARPTDMAEVADRLQEVYREVTGESYPRPYPKVSRDTAAALNNRAISLLDLGRGREAMSLWAEALANEPHHPEATFNYGMTLWRLGRITDAALVGLMEETVKSHGHDSTAPCYLGLVHQERDDLPAMADALASVGADSEVKALADTTSEETAERRSTARRATGTFPAEKGGLTSVALSGDGALLLTGGDDHHATLWDTATGKRRLSMKHGPRSVTSVALSSDGSLLATGGYRSVILWDGANGTITGELPGHDDWVAALSCSADGTMLLSLCWDGYVRLWEAARPDIPLWSHEGGAGYAVMTPDARFALFGAIDATVRLVDLKSFDTLATFDTPPGPLALSADGAVAIVADTEGEILVFDTQRPDAPRRILSGVRSPVACVALSDDGRLAATGAYDKTVRLWDVAIGRCLRTFEEHGDTPSAVAFGEGGKALFSAGWDAKAIRWELAIDAPPARSPLMVSRIVASEKALTAGAAYEQGLTQMRHALERGDTITAVRNLKTARNQPGFSREAEALTAWGDLYRRLPRAGLRGGWESFALPGHGGGVTSVAVSFDGRLALTGSHDRTARIWNLDNRETVAILTGSSGRITSVAFDAASSQVLTSSADGALRLWDAKQGTTLVTLVGHTGSVNAADLSADGRIGVSVGADILVRVWGLPQGVLARSLRGHAAPVNAVRIDPSGRLALTGGDDRTARFWDLASGVTLRVLSGHRGKINGVDLSSDTRRALTVSDDGALIMWDLETAQPIKTMRGGDTPAALGGGLVRRTLRPHR